MKKFIQFLMGFCLLFLLCSNVSQPGIYNGGGMAFTMLFPEDSLSYKKVQMQEEKIYIQLYKGFAVVKGTYKMVNTSNEKFNFKMGYPIKGIYNGGEIELNQVQLDSIYKFKVKSNNKILQIDKTYYDEDSTQNVMTFNNQNWLTWNMSFLPNQTNNVEVYFIVNTNEGQVTEGYNRKDKNTFIYLLESGSVWKQPIENGNFIIELKDDLKLEDIDGISNHFNFKKHPTLNILFGAKSNFSPKPKDNLIITYNKTLETFNFENLITIETQLYASVDVLSTKEIPVNLMAYDAQNPLKVKASALGYFPMIVTLAIIYGPFILIGILISIVLYIIYKKKKNNRKPNL